MPFLVRKIELSKWYQNDIGHVEDVSADAITSSLKTINNTLSTWLIENVDEVENAVLAIASQAEHIDTIDVVVLDLTNVEREELKTNNTPGLTPFKKFIDNHYDIIDLTYKTLGSVAKLIIESLQKQLNKRFTRGQLKTLLQSGVRDGRVPISKLKSSVIEKLKL